MELDATYYHFRTPEREYLIVRPGISICMIYDEPASSIGADIAKILEMYLAFVPSGSLQTYLSNSATWKKLSQSVMSKKIGALRQLRAGAFAGFHFGQEPLANVGEYGAHFKAGPLTDDFFDREANILYLEFPLSYAEGEHAHRLATFFELVVNVRPPDSGYCGYAFKHLLMTFTKEAIDFISQKCMRFIGFDFPEDAIRLWVRGRIYNISWLTVLGRNVLAELGGREAVQRSLDLPLETKVVGDGLFDSRCRCAHGW